MTVIGQIVEYSGRRCSAHVAHQYFMALGAGNLFIADTRNNRVVAVPQQGTDSNGTLIYNTANQFTLPATGLSYPQGVAVNQAGDVFITDNRNQRVVELPWAGSGYGPQIVLPINSLQTPTSVVVDNAGDIFVADFDGRQVVELKAPECIYAVRRGECLPVGPDISRAVQQYHPRYLQRDCQRHAEPADGLHAGGVDAKRK